MGTKKKKSKHTQTRKKRRSRGGATGSQITALYNKDDELIGVTNNGILDVVAYQKLNKVNPTYRLNDVISDLFSSENVFLNTERFFRPFDSQSSEPTITLTAKYAINDQHDIQLIQITNQVIKVLNGMKVKPGKLFNVKRYRGKITKDCIENFRNLYNNVLMREHENKILDKFKENPAYEKVVKLMLRTPILANLISIKFGVLRSGDMKITEMNEIFSYENPDKLIDALSELKSSRKINSKIVGMEQIIEEENKVIEKINNQMEEQIKDLKNCKENGICPDNTGNLSNEILGPNSIGGTSSSSSSSSSAFLPGSSSSSTSLPGTYSPSFLPGTSSPSFLPGTSSSSFLPSSSSSPSFLPSSAQATLSDHDVEMIINKDTRLLSLFIFNDALQIQNDNTKTLFFNYVKQNTPSLLDTQYALQNYLIENLLKVLNITDAELFDTSKATKDSSKYQSTVLTLLRILLTWHMRDYNKFKAEFDKQFKTNDICTPLQSGLDKLSSFSMFSLRIPYSYDKIIDNIEDEGYCGDFDEIITINLNKLYDMLKTKGINYMQDMRRKAFDKTMILTRYQEYNEEYNKTQYYIF